MRRSDMAKKTLNLPHQDNFPLKTVDTLYLKITQDCNWCYSDPTGVFGQPPDGFLAPGLYKATKPPTVYGPYKPQHKGDVTFETTPPGTPCTVKDFTPHTITVST
jgi:hypothetical protein